MRIALIAGGTSSEREISLLSGDAVERALLALGHQVTVLDTDRQSLLRLAGDVFDFAFIALHGPGGEDGVIQGFLETIGLPYNGSGVEASAVAMNKALTKQILEREGVRVPPSLLIRRTEPAAGFFPRAADELGLPFIAKPCAQGSTIGVHLVHTPSDLAAAHALIGSLRDDTLLERFVQGKELTVACAGERVFPAMEIETDHLLYDYEAKYQKGESRHYIPPRIPPELAARAQELAKRAHRLLGCRGVTRSDFRVTEQGEVIFLEINTLPGLTAVSLVPECAAADGLTYESLIAWLVEDGLARRREEPVPLSTVRRA